jgi:3-hydroxyisobutyrate dehydrogenase
VALLGTGLLGRPVAENLSRRGFEVHVWNRTTEKALRLSRANCAPHVSAPEAVAAADVVMMLLADGPATEEVLIEGGLLDAIGPDRPLIQSGTVGVESIERIATASADAGVTLIDAPVSGSRMPAEKGELILLVGAQRPVPEGVQAVFDAIGQRVQWAGGIGAGTRLKLVLQTWLVSLLESLAETVALAEAAGINPDSFLEAIAGGPLDTPYAHLKGGAMARREFDPAFPLRLLPKDARLAIEMAGGDAGELAPILELVVARAQKSIELGHGESDMAALFYACGRT